ncbi:hypothetical protein F66182_2796 [Fusarium sp. NRRL 66182]|nr:hypothetical protein F66182_2796 [Fusarium sp. NRRL 66182]
MRSILPVPTPPPESCPYSRASVYQASADVIPLLVDDTYHVFHLSTPPATRHHPGRLRSSWSRIRSRNLLEWDRDPEPVIRPGDSGHDADVDGAWTGSAILGPDDKMNIFYTGYNLSQDGRQTILRTRGVDRHGSRFETPSTPITIPSQGLDKFEKIDFRDPFVFYNHAEGQYWMLVATRLASGPYWSRGCIALLTSPDLHVWTVAPEPLCAPNDVFCPECPELFTLPNGKWYLIYSRFHAPNAGTVYRIADSPRGPFRMPRDGSHGRLDGRRWYAAKSCPKAGNPDKRLCFGWIGDYADDENKWLWGGDLGITRVMWADTNACLRIDASQEFRSYIWRVSRPVSPSNAAPSLYLCSLGTTATHFPELGSAEWKQDLMVDFKVAACDAHSFGIMLQADSSGKGHRLQFHPQGNGFFSAALTTDFPPLDDFWADQYRINIPRPVDGPELVRHDNISLVDGVFLFLRGQLVEVFCGGRALSFRLPKPPNRVDDGRSGVRRLGWFVEDGMVDLVDMSIRYSLSIHDGSVESDNGFEDAE